MTLSKLSQVQAARAAGVSRITIYRAIKNGTLSLTQDNDGRAYIDASELLRVYPDAQLEHARERAHEHAPNTAVSGNEHLDEHDDAAALNALRAHLRELQEDKQRMSLELERAAAERTRLLSMIEQKDAALSHKDRLLEEQMQTVKLLTDQRTRPRKWWARWW